MHLLSIVTSTSQSGKWEVSKPTKNYPDQTVQLLVLIQKKYERLYPQKLSRKIKWLSNCEGTRQILRYIYIGGKKTHNLSTGPGFNSQYLHGSSQSIASLVSGNQYPLLASMTTRHMCSADTHADNTHILKNKPLVYTSPHLTMLCTE